MAKLIVTIEDDLHQAFRIKCLRERKTMREKITRFIEAEVSGALEMSKETLEEFLAGKAEIEQGRFVTLEQAKKKYGLK